MTDPRYPLDLLLLDRNSEESLKKQLADKLRDLIKEGKLQPSERLPSIRDLSVRLKISRNTIAAAFDQLSVEGVIASRRGAGFWVANTGSLRTLGQRKTIDPHFPLLSDRGQTMTKQVTIRGNAQNYAFHPGTPEIQTFPFKIWSSILRRKLSPGGEDYYGYHSRDGTAQLKQSISEYLVTSRGVRCSPDQIIVTTGGQAALDVLARILTDEGDTVLMEEPGFNGARSAFLSAGANLEDLHVNEQGWQLSMYSGKNPRVIYLTPSCQHPLGVTMSLEARLQMLEFALEKRSWIIEDDYDGEYTFRGDPLPAMQGLTKNAPVIYVGTFAKTIFPALRIGYMVLPEDLAKLARTAVSITGQFAPLFLQATMSEFMNQGHFGRHLKKMRKLYGQRREYFMDFVGKEFDEWLAPLDGNTGIQIASFSKSRIDDEHIASIALKNGVNLAPLSSYYRSTPDRTGFVFGYAGYTESQMKTATKRVRSILDEVTAAS